MGACWRGRWLQVVGRGMTALLLSAAVSTRVLPGPPTPSARAGRLPARPGHSAAAAGPAACGNGAAAPGPGAGGAAARRLCGRPGPGLRRQLECERQTEATQSIACCAIAQPRDCCVNSVTDDAWRVLQRGDSAPPCCWCHTLRRAGRTPWPLWSSLPGTLCCTVLHGPHRSLCCECS